jgi:hypothetical protein
MTGICLACDKEMVAIGSSLTTRNLRQFTAGRKFCSENGALFANVKGFFSNPSIRCVIFPSFKPFFTTIPL